MLLAPVINTANISVNFRKKLKNGPNGLLRGLDEKKTEVKKAHVIFSNITRSLKQVLKSNRKNNLAMQK